VKAKSKVARIDQQYVWHPFTQMRDWLRRTPIVIVAGKGALLRDDKGREYLDANASIWTNLHGHNHPRINAAVRHQLNAVAHVSALGLANVPAALLAERLVQRAHTGGASVGPGAKESRDRRLERVFYSDDGSTAVEVALKLAYEFSRRTGLSRRPRFLSLQGAYHGDTVGAVSLGHIDLFHRSYAGLLFPTDSAMAPYCYRCPYNRARAERGDARDYRRCRWECVSKVERQLEKRRRKGAPYAGFVFEPLMQGAAGMIPQPTGWLRRVTDMARQTGALLVADEVLTGLGRTGNGPVEGPAKSGEHRMQDGERRPEQGPTRDRWFGCEAEAVRPDFLCLAKGLSGGYSPLAATMTTNAIFKAFLGEYEEFKTFFHGHSYTGNPLGAAAALASLDVLESSASRRARARLEQALGVLLGSLWSCSHVGDIRQVGLMAGIELVRDWRTREPYDLGDRVGIRVCEAMMRRGVLTRPIGNVIVLMPPYCTTLEQLQRMVGELKRAVRRVLGG
jgi:adenosylmethionine-8-amino-7-oxononanoate aminotransferase